MSVLPGFLLDTSRGVIPAFQVGVPDTWHCRPNYGVRLSGQECINAIMRMPRGDRLVEYSVEGPVGGDHTLPWSITDSK